MKQATICRGPLEGRTCLGLLVIIVVRDQLTVRVVNGGGRTVNDTALRGPHHTKKSLIGIAPGSELPRPASIPVRRIARHKVRVYGAAKLVCKIYLASHGGFR